MMKRYPENNPPLILEPAALMELFLDDRLKWLHGTGFSSKRSAQDYLFAALVGLPITKSCFNLEKKVNCLIGKHWRISAKPEYQKTIDNAVKAFLEYYEK